MTDSSGLSVSAPSSSSSSADLMCVPPPPPPVPPPLAALIRRSWSPKPEERPNFDEIINVLDTAIIDAVINDNAGEHAPRAISRCRTQPI